MTKSEIESKKRKKKSRNHGVQKNNNKPINNHYENEKHQIPLSSPSSSSKLGKLKTKPSSTFLDKMRARLSGGHFRMINEKLYTCTGKEALDYFQEDPSLFDMYHAGYKTQMSTWPEKPVNVIIKWLKKQSPSMVVADFGCGDALIAKSVTNKVFSLDLVSNDPKVIACDMSNAPIVSSSVDVAVFCLSLMGTNYQSYIEEANRVLKPGGWLLIAEVKSRFDPTNGGADPEKFSRAISDLGFNSVKQDFSNKMFILFYFTKKNKRKSKGKETEWPMLKPCLYKRR
ncbi:PREDICTED: ribosomal RNA-processing protein 8 isoform X2 [Lupinus angustifolius]|uniref:ribosomal RNA-processing protein 8 isoform X2 n=1 Tax=Lupinus angustifolius TaxID=3871 RepID=UPI00092EDCB3|nr:PREDICTED: ribosomal RNA-processing protein 8 isoform X2 [Lupinus angustifolius]